MPLIPKIAASPPAQMVSPFIAVQQRHTFARTSTRMFVRCDFFSPMLGGPGLCVTVRGGFFRTEGQ